MKNRDKGWWFMLFLALTVFVAESVLFILVLSGIIMPEHRDLISVLTGFGSVILGGSVVFITALFMLPKNKINPKNS